MPAPRQGLFHYRGQTILEWTTGRATAHVAARGARHHIPLSVKCRIKGMAEEIYALLDTGAEYSVISNELLEEVIRFTQELDAALTMSTRLGRVKGRLVKHQLTLLAEDGVDLPWEATMLALGDDWTGPPLVLGYRGGLENIRFALEPSLAQRGDPWLFFGPAAA